MSYTDQYSPLPTAPRTRRMSPQLGNGTAMAPGGGVSSPGQIGMMHPGLLAPSAPTSYSGAPQTMAAPMGPSLQQQNMGIAPRGPSPNSTAGMMQHAYNSPAFAYAMADRQQRDARAADSRAGAAMSAPLPSLYSPQGTASATLPGGAPMSKTYPGHFNNPLPALASRMSYANNEHQMASDDRDRSDYLLVPQTGSPSFSADRQTRLAGAAAAPGMYAAQQNYLETGAKDADKLAKQNIALQGVQNRAATTQQATQDRAASRTQQQDQFTSRQQQQQQQFEAQQKRLTEQEGVRSNNPNAHLLQIIQHVSQGGIFDPEQANSALQWYNANAAGGKPGATTQPQGGSTYAPSAQPEQYQPSKAGPATQPSVSPEQSAQLHGGQYNKSTNTMVLKDGSTWQWDQKTQDWGEIRAR